MRVRLADPELLALLVPLVALGLLLRRAFRPGPQRWGRRVLAATQWGAAALVVVALAQPQLSVGARPTTVLAIDRSASIDRSMRAAQLPWLRSVLPACARPCRVVEFARNARVLPDSAAALAANPPGRAAADATDLLLGVRAALLLAPRGGRVVVLSDGAATTGSTLAAVPLARSRHIQVDLVPLADPHRRDAAITQLLAPAVVHAGDPLPLLVTVRSTVDGRATLALARDGGSLGAQAVTLHRGDNPLLLPLTAPAPGWHSYTARITLPGDAVPENDSLSAVTEVVAEPRVLAVGAQAPPAAPLTGLLGATGLRVAQAPAAGLPATAAGYAGLDALVLDDVPAAALRPAQVAALTQAVQEGGLGLVVLGGPHSFSLGGYAHTRLEQLLPVASLVPGNQQHGNLAIELVLDHSGSMIELAGGVSKIAMIHVAGAETTRFAATHGDALGVVDFDAAAHLVVPIQRIIPGAVERHVIAAIDGLQAGGGTDIYAGLLAGARQVELSSAPKKHMILITDGIGQPENYLPLLRELRRFHVGVATIALGADADRGLLSYIARVTGGHAYVTDSAGQLPRIFAREARIAVQPVAVAGTVAVAPGGGSPVVRSLAGRALPPLGGDVVTALKEGALAALLARGPGGSWDPALAQWQVGLGRVVTWTPGLGDPWARSWAGETALWNDVVRWAERGASGPALAPTVVAGSPPVLRLDLAPAGAVAFGVSSITGRLTGSGGAVRRLRFTEVGPGWYQAGPGPLPAGVYRYALEARGPLALTASGELAVPYSEEYLPRPPGESSLYQLVARTGGRVLAAGDPQVLTGGGWLSAWGALAVCALAIFLGGAIVRLLWRPGGDGPDPGPASLAPLPAEASLRRLAGRR